MTHVPRVRLLTSWCRDRCRFESSGPFPHSVTARRVFINSCSAGLLLSFQINFI